MTEEAPDGSESPQEDGGSTRQKRPSVRETIAPKIKQFAEHVSYLKMIVLIGVGLLISGFAASRYMDNLATGEDLRMNLEPVGRSLASHEEKISDHASRINVIEIVNADMKQRDNIQSQQLYEIAIKVGARPVPGITIDAGATP